MLVRCGDCFVDLDMVKVELVMDLVKEVEVGGWLSYVEQWRRISVGGVSDGA